MKYNMYAIRDVKTGFLTPTVDLNDASAARNFAHACMSKGSLFFSHPGDYELYQIATYDSDSGQIEPVLLKYIMSAVDVEHKEV